MTEFQTPSLARLDLTASRVTARPNSHDATSATAEWPVSSPRDASPATTRATVASNSASGCGPLAPMSDGLAEPCVGSGDSFVARSDKFCNPFNGVGGCGLGAPVHAEADVLQAVDRQGDDAGREFAREGFGVIDHGVLGWDRGTVTTPEKRVKLKSDVPKIAALYVETGGVYYGLDGVDPWDEARDARAYAGPHPVVAHPPCKRWGRYWSGGPSAKVRREKGDNGGCFAAALASVREFGGVLEHPEASHAWRAFGLNPPPRSGGWVAADLQGGWTCCVEQGHYGHRARKATWIYACGVDLPPMKWGASESRMRMEPGFHSRAERQAASDARRLCKRLSARERLATPPEFRDLLLSIARTANNGRGAA